MDLLEKPVYNYIKNNHGVITFRDMEELNFSYQQLNQLVSRLDSLSQYMIWNEH